MVQMTAEMKAKQMASKLNAKLNYTGGADKPIDLQEQVRGLISFLEK